MDGAGHARAVHRSRVEWMDTDAAGHHHNSAIVRYVEAAEATLMRESGVDGYFGAAPRVHYEVDFTARLWFQQEVTTVLVIDRIGTASMGFRFEVWGDKTDDHPRALAASGRYVTVNLPAGRHTSEPWPDAWVAAWRNAASVRVDQAESREPDALPDVEWLLDGMTAEKELRRAAATMIDLIHVTGQASLDALPEPTRTAVVGWLNEMGRTADRGTTPQVIGSVRAFLSSAMPVTHLLPMVVTDAMETLARASREVRAST